MVSHPVDKERVARFTEEYGGSWGINHTRRLLNLVAVIGAGKTYDEEAVWLAAHLHDWGAYPPWAEKNVDHATRSRLVADEYLSKEQVNSDLKALVLECIEYHHGGNPNPHIESTLIADADGLDFLGVVGVLRDCSKSPKNLRAAYETIKRRMAQIPATLRLDESKVIAATRIAEMEQLFSLFEKESFGLF